MNEDILLERLARNLMEAVEMRVRIRRLSRYQHDRLIEKIVVMKDLDVNTRCDMYELLDYISEGLEEGK